MKLLDIIKSANANLLRNKGRTFLTILAVFVGSFTIILTSGIRTGVNSYIDTQMNNAGGENVLEISSSAMSEAMEGSMMGGSSAPKKYDPSRSPISTTGMAITGEQLNKARKINNIESVSPFIMTRMTSMIPIGVAIKYAVGVNGEKYEFDVRSSIDGVNLDIREGTKLDNQTKERQIAIGMDYVAAFGFKDDKDAIGKELTIYVLDRGRPGKLVPIKAKIVAVLNKSILTMSGGSVNDSLARAMLDAASQNLQDNFRQMYTMATAQLKPNLSDAELDKIKDQLKEIGLSGMTAEEEVGMIKAFFDAIILVFTIFGGIALLAASIGIINTLFMAVQERTREIGLMKAMGLGRSKIFLMFSIEAISLGFWGSALGVGVAYLVKMILNPLAADTFLKDLPGFNLMKFDLVLLLLLVALVMAIAFLAGTLPARRAARKDPIEALRYE
ncbi:FtsX-like permease family protein [Candidatus Saccharibacteria bacterium]|nr:FtsX-like permease family protein [Candidatus Saccharibacteria bacterium]